MTGADVRVAFDDMPKAEVGTSDRVVVVGGGRLRGEDLSRMHCRSLALVGDPGLLDHLRIRISRRADLGRVPVFEDCDFSGLSVDDLDLGVSRFIRCRFEDVDVHVRGTSHAHFVDCVFTGRWDGNFSAQVLPEDPGRRVEITGNDFRGLYGMSFMGGVAIDHNRFDIGGRHLLLQRGGPGWAEATQRAMHDQLVARELSSIEGRGPFDYAQDWQIYDRETSPEMFTAD